MIRPDSGVRAAGPLGGRLPILCIHLRLSPNPRWQKSCLPSLEAAGEAYPVVINSLRILLGGVCSRWPVSGRWRFGRPGCRLDFDAVRIFLPCAQLVGSPWLDGRLRCTCPKSLERCSAYSSHHTRQRPGLGMSPNWRRWAIHGRRGHLLSIPPDIELRISHVLKGKVGWCVCGTQDAWWSSSTSKRDF